MPLFLFDIYSILPLDFKFNFNVMLYSNKRKDEHIMTEDTMGSLSVKKLLIKTSIPLTFSLLISSLYNFVDSIFVSYVSENALTAVSLAAPIQNLGQAFGCAIAVGLNAVISKALGEKNEKAVKNAASAAIFLAVCLGIIMTVFGLLIAKPYYMWQSGGNEEITNYGTQYLSVVMMFAIFNKGQWVFDRFVISSGKPHLFLFTLSASSITNLILDPIFIFGYFGLPAMGTTGAALATGIGSAMGCIAGIIINRRYNKAIPIVFTMKPDKKSVVSILKVGIPSFLSRSIMTPIGIAMNSILIGFSSTAVAVYGICLKIQSLAIVIANGIGLGVIPIVAYNYGAKKYKRIHDTVKNAMIFSFVVFAVIFAMLEIFPFSVMRLFDASDEMSKIGIPALRTMSLAWLISLPNLALSPSFQGLSRGTDSMAVTLTSQAVLPLCLVFAISMFGNLNLVWFGFVLAEAFALPLGVLLWRRAVKLTLK